MTAELGIGNDQDNEIRSNSFGYRAMLDGRGGNDILIGLAAIQTTCMCLIAAMARRCPNCHSQRSCLGTQYQRRGRTLSYARQ